MDTTKQATRDCPNCNGCGYVYKRGFVHARSEDDDLQPMTCDVCHGETTVRVCCRDCSSPLSEEQVQFNGEHALPDYCEACADAELAFEAEYIMRQRREVQPFRFGQVTCSSCGQTFGASNSGFSHCYQHKVAH